MSTEASLRTDPAALESVCDSLAFPAELAEFLPVVFSRCTGLGGLIAPVLQLLTSAGVDRGDRVIDLACGKGHITCAIARRFGSRVSGIDACGALLREARATADDHDIGKLVRFRRSDVLELRPSRHDVAVMIGWLGAEHAPSVLRAHVKTGGHYLFDDATRCRTESMAKERVRRCVDSRGDELVVSRIVRREILGAAIRRDLRFLKLGTSHASARNPSVARELNRWFARFQRHADSIVRDYVVAYHLCRKGP